MNEFFIGNHYVRGDADADYEGDWGVRFDQSIRLIVKRRYP